MSLYTINDVELEIDMEDYDFQKKYEEAFGKMGGVEKELQKVGKKSELTRGYCQMFRNLFDDIFGPGTSEKLFGDKYNMRITDEVYEKFLSICYDQARKAETRRSKTINKYKPNRSQRRSK